MLLRLEQLPSPKASAHISSSKVIAGTMAEQEFLFFERIV